MARPTATERRSVYEIISAQILSSLEKGSIPWKRPWTSRGGQRNVRGNSYRGINQLLLGAIAMDRGYASPIWLTFNQARGLGGNVKKGEKGTPVVFWKKLDKKDAAGADKSFFMLRYYTVFSLNQCENVTVATSEPAKVLEPLAECEKVVATMPKAPVIQHTGDRACYIPSQDKVNMPPRDSFHTVEHYYSTLFHEIGHSTGHASRLGRKGITEATRFDNHAYGQEELIAEFTAAFLCGTTGIVPVTVEDSAGYIDHWMKAIKADEKLVVNAAAQAQKATDYVLGGLDAEEEEDEAEAA